MRRTIVIATLLALVLAGCTGAPDDESDDSEPTTEPTVTTTPTATPPTTTPTPATPTPPLDSSSYSLAVVSPPTLAKPGVPIGFTLAVTGSQTRASEHVGAHYADNDTASPNASAMQPCDHGAGELPGAFNVSCAFGAEGSWYVWGHARVNDSGELREWWAPSPFLVKVRDYNLTLARTPSGPQGSNSSFTILLDVRGVHNDTSDHIGAHFWNASEEKPSLDNVAGSCEHVEGGLVGNHTIACSIFNDGLAPKDFFLRGHARLTDGATSIEWWSAEARVSILGGLPLGGL